MAGREYTLAVKEGFEDGDFADGRIEAETDQIGAVAGVESTLASGDGAHAGGISRG
jgi:hypothetical protein